MHRIYGETILTSKSESVNSRHSFYHKVYFQRAMFPILQLLSSTKPYTSQNVAALFSKGDLTNPHTTYQHLVSGRERSVLAYGRHSR